MSRERITIDTVVAAPPETAWACWTEPDHITQWNFASEDWCCPSAENDLSVDGRYKARMEAKDGSFGSDFEASAWPPRDPGTSEHEVLVGDWCHTHEERVQRAVGTYGEGLGA